MPDGPDIQIGLSTTGADAAAQEIAKIPAALEQIPASVPAAVDTIGEIPEAIGKIPAAVPAAGEAMKKIPEALRETTAALDDQKEKTDAAAAASEQYAKRLDQISEASRTMVAMATVEALKKTTSALRDATKEGGLLHDQAEKMGPALDTVDNGLDMMTVGLGTAVATGNPLIGLLAGVAKGFFTVFEAYGKMRKAEDDAEAEQIRAADAGIKLHQLQIFTKKHLAEITQIAGIEAENAALTAQENALKRLIDLRERMQSTANKGARQEVEMAKLKGGDVALAEANVMAVELQGELNQLKDNLAQVKQSASAATQAEASANVAWAYAQEQVAAGMRGLWDADTQALKKTAEDASAKGAAERQKLADTINLYGEQKNTILRGAEIELARYEKESRGPLSAAAKKALDGIYNTVRQEVATTTTSATEVISQIQADGDKVYAAAMDKAQEVSAAIQTAGTGSAKAVQGVGTVATATAAKVDQAVAGAADQVTKALDELTNKVVASLARIAANGVSNANRLAAQETQINQLFSRLR